MCSIFSAESYLSSITNKYRKLSTGMSRIRGFFLKRKRVEFPKFETGAGGNFKSLDGDEKIAKNLTGPGTETSNS